MRPVLKRRRFLPFADFLIALRWQLLRKTLLAAKREQNLLRHRRQPRNSLSSRNPISQKFYFLKFGDFYFAKLQCPTFSFRVCKRVGNQPAFAARPPVCFRRPETFSRSPNSRFRTEASTRFPGWPRRPRGGCSGLSGESERGNLWFETLKKIFF